ncbi:probable alpha-1,6-mannosyltransferase MNN11 [Kluyveromyces marxianus]|nr:probable alpha-1,6-mannosyltransferase MNN11 [Kluyveromyces marxianus]
MPFIPKNKNKWAKSFKIWTSSVRFHLQKRGRVSLLFVIALFLFLSYGLSSLFSGQAHHRSKIPPVHGLYKSEVASSTPLIFPSVQYHDTLRSLGIESLFTLRTDIDGNKQYIMKPDDPPMTEAERKELSEKNLRKFVKRNFYDHGKLVYKNRVNHPEVVIVSLIDFEGYSVDHLVKTVQNKVDYAQRHNYGVYVRWAQEFIPQLQKQSVSESYEFIKPLAIRAAMNAFPYAKYFWFVDQNGLIMDLDKSLQQHLLEPKILDAATLKSLPVIEGSNIKTYKHFDSRNAKIMIPKTENGNLDTSSFVVTPSLQGKAFLDYINDPLVRNYPFPNKLSSTIGHMLEWHPSILQRTALVVPKTIASSYKPATSQEGSDSVYYKEGDFVITFAGCEISKSCEAELAKYYEKVKLE